MNRDSRAETADGPAAAPAFLERALRQASHGLAIAAAGGHHAIVYVNAGFERLTGRPAGTAIGLDLAVAIGTLPRADEAARLRDSLRAGMPCVVVAQSVSEDGWTIWNEVTITPVRDDAGRQTHVLAVLEDVTADRRLDDELASSQQRYAQLVDSIDGLVQEIDVESGVITFVSRQVEHLLGYDAETWTAPGFVPSIVHPDDRELYARVVAGDAAARRHVYRLRHADGSFVWIRDRSANVLDEHGRRLRRSLLLNVSATMVAEREARLRQVELEAIFQAFPDLLFRLDRETRVLDYRAGSHSVLAASRDEIVGLHLADVLPDHAGPDLQRAAELVLADGRPAAVEYSVGVDGAARVFEARVQRLHDDEVIIVVRDVTERRRAELERARSEAQYHALVEDLQEVVFRTDAEGRWTYLNRAWTDITGFDVAGSLGRPFLDYVHPDDRAENLERFRPLIAQETSSCRHVVRYRSADGGFRWIEVHARLSFDETGAPAGTTGTLSDVTAQHLAAHELRVAKEIAESASRMKSEFLASMSHELRTPLNAILTLSESLTEGVYGPLADEQTPSVQTITESGRHLMGLINDILDLSKIEAGRMDLHLEPVEIDAVCQASLRLIRQQAQVKRQEVSLAIAAAGQCVADQRKLKQILVNLLSNAVKFTPAHGRIGLDVDADRETGRLRFVVWDTGIGIPPEDLERLFKPFVQLDSKLSREHSGTGLGLSLAYRLTELHGGSVTLESTVGVGSRFTVTLPWAPETGDDAPADGTAAVPAPDTRGPGGRVLLVEDNAISAQAMLQYLTAKGFVVEHAANGEAAVRAAQAWEPDIVLMDVQMPGVDGLEATRRIRRSATGATVPIIALTALAMAGDRERCLSAGANDYVTKPVTLKDLVERVRRHLDLAA